VVGRGVTLALCLSAFTIPAVAGPFSPYTALNLPDVVNPTLPSAPVGRITAGPLAVGLEVTPLGEVQRRFGGRIGHAGDAGEAVSWLCFIGRSPAGTPIAYWFMANDEMSGDSHEVTEVAVQSNPPATALHACKGAPATLGGVGFGVPSVGRREGEVIKYFGGGHPDRRGYLSYSSEVRSKTSAGFTVLQSVRYLFVNGMVNTISVSQVTSG
jgi:hypothetical protein